MCCHCEPVRVWQSMENKKQQTTERQRLWIATTFGHGMTKKKKDKDNAMENKKRTPRLTMSFFRLFADFTGCFLLIFSLFYSASFSLIYTLFFVLLLPVFAFFFYYFIFLHFCFIFSVSISFLPVLFFSVSVSSFLFALSYFRFTLTYLLFPLILLASSLIFSFSLLRLFHRIFSLSFWFLLYL